MDLLLLIVIVIAIVKVGDTTWLCLHNRTDIVGCETIKQTN